MELVEIGAYEVGAVDRFDRALAMADDIRQLVVQSSDNGSTFEEALDAVHRLSMNLSV